jgi:hypothetical protein
MKEIILEVLYVAGFIAGLIVISVLVAKWNSKKK